jgi:hypothetical protein
MYVKVNLARPIGISPGSGSGMDKVIIIDADDVLVYPPRDANGVKHLGSFVMKPNGFFHEMYTTKSKGSAAVESDGDEDSVSIKSMFETQHPGNKAEVKEFVQNWLGRNVYILHKSCDQDYYEVIGTPCSPLQLKPSRTLNNDAKFWMLKFEAFAKSNFVPGDYYGEIVTTAPTAVADATSIEVTEENGYQYRLPVTNAVTVLAIDDAVFDLVHNDIITFIGSGGTNPLVINSVDTGTLRFIQEKGFSWTALNGSVINYRVYKDGGVFYLIELSRA